MGTFASPREGKTPRTFPSNKRNRPQHLPANKPSVQSVKSGAPEFVEKELLRLFRAIKEKAVLPGRK